MPIALKAAPLSGISIVLAIAARGKRWMFHFFILILCFIGLTRILWSLNVIQFPDSSLENVIQKHLTCEQHEHTGKAPPRS